MAEQNIGSDILVDDEHVYIIRDLLGKTWQDMGRYLGIPNARLENMAVDLNASGVSEMTYHVLNMWRQEKGEVATLDVLIGCMEKLKRRDIVLQLKKSIQDAAKRVPLESDGSPEDATKHGPHAVCKEDCEAKRLAASVKTDPSLAEFEILPKHKNYVANNIPREKWRYLGEILGFCSSRLDAIEEETNKKVASCCRITLEEWIEEDERSLADLVLALKEVGCRLIATKLEKMSRA